MLFIEKPLPLAHHSQHAVVEHHFYYGDIMRRSGYKLVKIHSKAAVARDVYHRFGGTARFCSYGSSQTVPHSSESARGNKAARVLIPIILRRPHLILTDLGADNSFSVSEPVQSFHYRLRGNGQSLCSVLLGLAEIRRDNFLRPLGVVLLGDFPAKLSQRRLYVAFNGDSRLDILVEFRGIDIYMNYFRVLSELTRVAYNTIGEARSHRYEQIAAV